MSYGRDGERYNPDGEEFPWGPLLAAMAAGFGVVMIGSWAFGRPRTTAASTPGTPGVAGTQPSAARPTAAQCVAAKQADPRFTGEVASAGDRCRCITNLVSPGGTQPCGCPAGTSETGAGTARRCCPAGQRANSTGSACVVPTPPAGYAQAPAGYAADEDAMDLLLG
jgi:hypothetical protein